MNTKNGIKINLFIYNNKNENKIYNKYFKKNLKYFFFFIFFFTILTKKKKKKSRKKNFFS